MHVCDHSRSNSEYKNRLTAIDYILIVFNYQCLETEKIGNLRSNGNLPLTKCVNKGYLKIK